MFDRILIMSTAILATTVFAQADRLDYKKYENIYQQKKSVSDSKRTRAEADKANYQRKVHDRETAESNLRAIRRAISDNKQAISTNESRIDQLENEINQHQSNAASFRSEMDRLSQASQLENQKLDGKNRELTAQSRVVEKEQRRIRDADANFNNLQNVLRSSQQVLAQRYQEQKTIADDVASIQQHLQVNRDRVRELERLNEQLTVTNQNLNSEREKIVDDNQHILADIDDANRRLTQLQDDAFAIKKQIIDSQSEVDELTRELRREERTLKQAQDDLDTIMKKADALKLRAEELEKSIAADEKKATELATKLEELKTKKAELEQKIAAAGDDEELLNKLKNQLSKVEENLIRLDGEAETLQQTIAANKKQSQAINQELTSMRPEVGKARAEVRIAQQKVEAVQSKLAIANTQLATRQAREAELTKQIGMVTKRIETLQVKVAAGRERIKQTVLEEKTNNDSIVANNNTISTLLQRREVMRGNLNQAQSRLQSKNEEVAIAENLVAEDDRNLKAAGRDLRLAQQDLAAEEKVYADLDAQRAAIVAQINALANAFDDNERRLDAEDAAIARKTTDIANLESQIENYSREITRLENQGLSVESQIVVLKSDEATLLATWQTSDARARDAEEDTRVALAKYREISANFNAQLDRALADAKNLATGLGAREANERATPLARKEGLADGQAKGEVDGRAAKQRDLYKAAYDLEYPVGQEHGRRQGESDGKQAGYADGYAKGKEIGLAEGYENGRQDGYKKGYDEQFAAADNTANEDQGRQAGIKAGTAEAEAKASREQTPKGFEFEKAIALNAAPGDGERDLNSVELDQSNTETETFDELRPFPTTLGEAQELATAAFMNDEIQTVQMVALANELNSPFMQINGSFRMSGTTVQIPDPNYTYANWTPNYEHSEIDAAYVNEANGEYAASFTAQYEAIYRSVYKENYDANYRKFYNQLYAKDYPASTAQGKNEGHKAGYDNTYTNSRRTAYNANYPLGKAQGRTDHLQTRYDEGFKAGYDNGSSEGTKDGSSSAYQRGFNDGRETGFAKRLPTAEAESYLAGRKKLRSDWANSAFVKIVKAEFENKTWIAGESVNVTITVRNFGGAASRQGDVILVVNAQNNRLHLGSEKVSLKSIPAFSEAKIVHTINATAISGAKGYEWYRVKLALSLEQKGQKTSEVELASDKDIEHLIAYKSEARQPVSIPQGGNSWNRIHATFTNASRATVRGYQYKIEPKEDITRVYQGDTQTGWRELPAMGAGSATQVSVLLQRVPGRMPARDQLESDGRTWKKHTMWFTVRDSKGKIVYRALYYVPVYFY